jgi:hypothetical protein
MQTYQELALDWGVEKATIERARTTLGRELTEGRDYQRGENNALLWLPSGAEKLRNHLQSRGQLPLAAVAEPDDEGIDLNAIVEAVVDDLAGEIADQVSRRLPRRIYGIVYQNLLTSITRKPAQTINHFSEAIGAIAGKS